MISPILNLIWSTCLVINIVVPVECFFGSMSADPQSRTGGGCLQTYPPIQGKRK